MKRRLTSNEQVNDDWMKTQSRYCKQDSLILAVNEMIQSKIPIKARIPLYVGCKIKYFLLLVILCRCHMFDCNV
jgi:hypothetical protein